MDEFDDVYPFIRKTGIGLSAVDLPLCTPKPKIFSVHTLLVSLDEISVDGRDAFEDKFEPVGLKLLLELVGGVSREEAVVVVRPAICPNLDNICPIAACGSPSPVCPRTRASNKRAASSGLPPDWASWRRERRSSSTELEEEEEEKKLGMPR